MQQLRGIFCALWTPTDSTGAILWDALEKHLSFLLDTQIAGIMALGSTGEFPHLSLVQREQLLERVVTRCKARGRRIIANVSDVQIRKVVHLARYAKALGADCVSVLPPWFYPMEQRDLAEFFIQVAQQSGAPLALYNYPEVTGKKIELATIRTVARRAKLIAVKQSGAEFSYHPELLELGRELGFSVLSGADTRLTEVLQMGCTGSVSGLSNAVPEALCKACEDPRSSGEQTTFVAELSRRIDALLFPLNVKAAIEARGFETGSAKSPVSAESAAVYERVVREVRELYQSVGLR